MSTLDEMEIDSLRDQLSELAGNMQALVNENETLTKIITADAQLAGAVATIKQLTKEVQVLRERNAALMDEKNLAIRQAKLAAKKKVI